MISLGFISVICMLIIARNVWFKRDDLSIIKKVIWTIMALFFSVGTLVAYFLFFNKKSD